MEKTSKNQFIGRQSTVFLGLFLRSIRAFLFFLHNSCRPLTVDRRLFSIRVSPVLRPSLIVHRLTSLLFLHNICRLSPARVRCKTLIVERQSFSPIRVITERSDRVSRQSLIVQRHPSRLWTVICGLIILLFCTSITHAQRLTTPPLHHPLVLDLETFLQAFYQSERDAQLTAFDTNQSGNWKDLLPSVGVGYNFSNQPRPTVSWSPISILNRKDNRRKEALTRDAMLRSYDVVISDHLFTPTWLYKG